MADGGSRQGAPPRPSAYPSSSNQKRDAAYLNIFGYTPPAGRSHTMTSQTPQYPAGRSRTMTSQTGTPESFANYPQQMPVHHPTMPNPPPSAPPIGPNGYNQFPYFHSAAASSASVSASPLGVPPQISLPPSSQQIQPNQPQRQYPGRTQYPLPQRMDSWSPSQQLRPYPMYPAPRGAASHAASPVPPVPPALNSDPNRSRSLAAMNPAPYHPSPPAPAPAANPQPGYPTQQAPMMPSYRPPAPPSQPPNPQGYRASPVNMLPETPENDRAMSMSYNVRQAMGAGRMAQARRMDPSQLNPATPASMERPSFERLQLQQGAPPDESPPTVTSQQTFSTMNDSSSQPSAARTNSDSSALEPRVRHPSDGSGSLKSNNSKPSISTLPEVTTSINRPDSSGLGATLNSHFPVQEKPQKTLVTHRSSTALASTSDSGVTGSRRSRHSEAIPIVYPALLSRVADAFQEMMLTTALVKGDAIYTDAFTGADAVDVLSTILRNRDRTQALLMGRALDAQNFIVDVVGEARLRDSREEVYQFNDTTTPASQQVNSVSTLLTECYSPTCSRQRLCYSVTCPRRAAQQSLLKQTKAPAAIRSSASKASIHAVDEDPDQQKLWSNSVPKDVVENTPDREKKRQEVIFEVMYTERDFVKDLEYLRDFWMRPLHSGTATQLSPISEHRREKFIRTVFGNCLEVLSVNARFAEALNARQKEGHVVKQVGDIFCQFAPQFTPFIKYGSNQIFGKNKFEKEKADNPAFAAFVEETEHMKESRKLDLNGYLTKPTTRLARYPLFLENILKYTPDDNPDKKDLATAVAKIREILGRVNAESGKAENHFNLVQLNDTLRFPAGEHVDLCLTDEHRTIIFKIQLKKGATDNSEVTAYLLDHALLLVRNKKKEECFVYRKPIPLELLSISAQDEAASKGPLPRRAVAATPGNATHLPINIRHLGKGGFDITLFAAPPLQGRKFVNLVEEHQRKQRERYGELYTKKTLITKFFCFNTSIKVNCAVPIDFGRKLVIGTDSGIYLSDLTSSNKPRKVLEVSYVTQIDVVEELQILLILAKQSLMYFSVKPLLADDVGSSSASLSRPKKAQVHANFFKVDHQFVYTVKTASSSTTLRMFEPLESKFFETTRKLSGKSFFGGDVSDNLNFRMRCEATVPHETYSLHVLKQSKSMTVCLGGARGFEVVNVATGKWEPLLNLGDTSLDVINRRETVRPIRFDRVHDGLFLTHYSECSLFINASGWRERRDWEILWEGTPNAFAFCNPYILAFDQNFIEIRHIESNDFVHVITGNHLRLLHSSDHEVLYAYEEDGDDVIAMLTFDNSHPPQTTTI